MAARSKKAFIVNDTTLLVHQDDVDQMREITFKGDIVKMVKDTGKTDMYRVELAGKTIQETVIMQLKSMKVEISNSVN